jgi:hypothetical protein
MLQLCLIVIGFSLATSALLLRYRDLNQVWELLLQAGFFVAPVVYPLSILPERLHFYLYLWPPTAVIQFARSVLVLGRCRRCGPTPCWPRHPCSRSEPERWSSSGSRRAAWSTCSRRRRGSGAREAAGCADSRTYVS